MPTFKYKARNQTGELVSRTVVADTSVAAARMLDDLSLLPIEIEEVKDQKQSFWTGGTRRISISKIGLFYEQLSDLLKAGVPVLRSLEVLTRQASTPALSRVLREVHENVAGGDSLADAMEKHPHAFPHLHVTMVRAGEKGGFMEDVLARMSEFVSRQDTLRNKFFASMIYPCILLLGGLGAVVFLMTFVVPKIRGPLSSQPNLPWMTTAVFGVSDVIAQHYLILAGVLLMIVIGVVGFFQSAAGRLARARLQLRAPVIGKIYTMVSLCRFCRIFGTLLNNGIPMLQSLRIAKDSTGNTILSDCIEQAAENVGAGEPLAAPLAASRVFPPAIVDMIAVAEESNTLEKVLVEIANTQEERTARQIDLAVRLVEPLMLVLIGAMVMFIALAMLVPILKMSSGGLKG